MIIDVVFGFIFGSNEPRKSNSEVDNNHSYCCQQENHVLHNGTDVATECHVATLLGIGKFSSIVVIRSLYSCMSRLYNNT